ncbi:aldose 1-epimerase [Paenibacillus sp. strain BS8-2]
MTQPFSWQVMTKGSYTSVTLSNNSTGASVTLVPELGFQAVSYQVDGMEWLQAPQDLEELQASPTKWGIPILFPPNRVSKEIEVEGRRFCFPQPAEGVYMHGELCKQAWPIVEVGLCDAEGVAVTTRQTFHQYPGTQPPMPCQLDIVFTYRLSNSGLRLEGKLCNHGAYGLPVGVGMHPYFRLPDAGAESVQVQIPAIAEWPIGHSGFIEGQPRHTPLCEQLHTGIMFNDLPPQSGYRLFSMRDGVNHSHISYNERKKCLRLTTSEQLSHIVLFVPQWTRAISLEPYSCVTDAYHVPLPWEDTGARLLQKGDSLLFFMEIAVEDM